MEKIFYTTKSAYPTSEEAVRYLLSVAFGIDNATIFRNENGKPFLQNDRDLSLFFSVSHTKELLFIAFSDENIGIDAELSSRSVDYLPIIKKFSKVEQNEISSTALFLKHWVAKESAVKWLGGSLAQDLHKISFVDQRIYYKDIPLPVYITVTEFNGHMLAICSERNSKRVECIPFP